MDASDDVGAVGGTPRPGTKRRRRTLVGIDDHARAIGNSRTPSRRLGPSPRLVAMMTGGLDGCPAGTFMIWSRTRRPRRPRTSRGPRQARASDRHVRTTSRPSPSEDCCTHQAILLSDDRSATRSRPFSEALPHGPGQALHGLVVERDGGRRRPPPLRHCAPRSNRTTASWVSATASSSPPRPGRSAPCASRIAARASMAAALDSRMQLGWRDGFDGSRAGLARSRGSARRGLRLVGVRRGIPRRPDVSVASDDPKGPFLAASPDDERHPRLDGRRVVVYLVADPAPCLGGLARRRASSAPAGWPRRVG